MKPSTRSLWSWGLSGIGPGVLAGTLFACLLFFLNPGLPFTIGPVIRALAFFGLIGGVASVLLHLPLSSTRWIQPWRLLPWTVTAVLFAAALFDWVHASRFSFYLPPAIDNRLIKAAIWLSLATLVSFYTALLHTLNRRTYHTGSRILLVSCACLSVLLTVERRAAFVPRLEATARASLRGQAEPSKLLVVGIDAASLEAILPLTEQGQLPFLANLMRQGAYGRLITLEPVARMPLWFSLATGRYPFRHGIVSEEQYRAPFVTRDARLSLLPVGLGVSRWGPFLGMSVDDSSAPPRAPALWELLRRTGARTAVVGWPAPQRSLAGADVLISESLLLHHTPSPFDKPPEAVAQAIASRAAATSLSPDSYLPFGDRLDRPLREALKQDLWREAIARQQLSSGADAVFVHLTGLQEAAERFFGGYMAFQFEGLQGADLEEASRIVTAYYAHLDEILDRLWAELPTPRLMVIASAWGTDEVGTLRSLASSLTGRRRTLSGRFDTAPDGILMLLGDNLSSGTYLDRAHLLDLTPTILYGLGLPVARDLTGTVLTKGFSATFLNRTPLTFVPAYPHSATEPYINY